MPPVRGAVVLTNVSSCEGFGLQTHRPAARLSKLATCWGKKNLSSVGVQTRRITHGLQAYITPAQGVEAGGPGRAGVTE